MSRYRAVSFLVGTLLALSSVFAFSGATLAVGTSSVGGQSTINPCDHQTGGAAADLQNQCPSPTPSCDVVVVNAQGGHPGKTECPSSTPVVSPPSGPVLTCGGTVSFTAVPAGWYLIVEPGDLLYSTGFDAIALTPGVYTYQFRDAGANDMVGGTFTIAACATPTPVVQPPAAPVLTCGGTVAFTAVPAGWYLIVEPGDLLYSTGFASITLTPGVYTYEFRDALANDKVGGTFTIVACATPSPTVSASASPTASSTASATATATVKATATPTGHGASPTAMPDTTTGGFGGSGDSPLPIVLFGLALLLGGAGVALSSRRSTSHLTE